MNQITFDDSLSRQVSGLAEPCIVVNQAGKKIGYFTPEVPAAIYEKVKASISLEELKRRSQMEGGRTLAEIMADLEKRA